MSPLAMVWHQFRFDQKVFWRNPPAVGFTVMFPVIFLVLIATIGSGSTIHTNGGISLDSYFVPAVLALALVSATISPRAMIATRSASACASSM